VKNYPDIAIEPYGDRLPDELMLKFPSYHRDSFTMPFAGQNAAAITI